MLKILTIIVLSLQYLLAQHLYYPDGSLFPLSVSQSRITVKFNRSVSLSQQKSFLKNLFQVDQSKEKRQLPNNFISVPLKANANVSTLIKNLQETKLLEAIFPVYVTKELKDIIMYDEFLVRFKTTVAAKNIEDFASRHGVEIISRKKVSPDQYTFRWMPAADDNPLNMSNMFFDSLDCVWATPDFAIQGSFFDVIPNDPYFVKQYYLHNTAQEPIPGEGHGTVGADIKASQAWDISLGSSNITIAVIDEGVKPHEDLPASRILPGYDFAGNDQTYQTTPPDNNPSPDGNEAHGMACAGIIAASQNSVGIAGIAPNCKILPVKIGDFRGAFPTISKVGDAVDFAWQNGADVISGSWGYYTSNPNNPLYSAIRDAINRAMTQGRNGLGTVCVFAAGNNGNGSNYVAFPANLPGVIAVGAIDKNNNKQSYSPQGSKLDITVPSGALAQQIFLDVTLKGNVWSLEIPGQIGWNPGDYNTQLPPDQAWIDYSFTQTPKGDSYPPGNYTARFGGTSAACPQAAGVAALILPVDPSLSSQQVKDVIDQTADDLGSAGFDVNYGYGRLNAYKALHLLTSPPAVVQNFQLTKVATGGIYRPKLTWNANTEPNLAGYLIERRIDSGAWAVPNNGDVSKDATSFVDYEIIIWNYSNYQTAFYRLRAYNSMNLYSGYTPIKSIDFHIMLKPLLTPKETPKSYALSQNYPNPFNPSTEIKYSLKEAGHVTLKIFDMLGREVRTLINENETAGIHKENFQPENLSSGIYFYSLTTTPVGGQAVNFHQTRKMILLR